MEVEIDDLISRFTWADYTVFSSLLAASAAIGIYYGCAGKGMENTKDYLMAGKSMPAFPVAMSLIASFISAITLLGTPSEIYQTGITYVLIVIGFIAVPVSGYVFLPVFWELQLTSVFEYLEIRFDKRIRRLGSILFIVVSNFYMAFVIYAPSLALAHVTGLNVYLSVSAITFIGMFYTALGGMKAVLWTDALQTVIMYGSVLIIVFKGTMDLGGVARVWEIGSMGNRTLLWETNPDPRVRYSIWTQSFGHFFYWMSIFGVNQTQVQRYLCVDKLSTSRRLLMVSWIGITIILIMACWIGMMAYAKYVACDPIYGGIIDKPDQIVPLFVLHHFSHWISFPGVFIAGVFSSTLSTVSSGISSLTAITLEDFLKGICCTKLTEKKATFYSKMLSVAYGIMIFLLVILVSQLGDVMAATTTLNGVIYGPMLAVFSLGMFFPSANSKGALVGTITSLIISVWLVLGQYMGINNKRISTGKLPINICDNFTIYENITNEDILNLYSLYQTEGETIIPDKEFDLLTEIYRISFNWLSLIGFFVSICIGLLVSNLTGGTDIKQLDVKLLSPVVFLFRKKTSFYT